MVSDVIMPPIGLLVGGVNFTDLKIVMKEAIIENGAEVVPAVTLNYGNFLQVLFDFLIIALTIFFVIRMLAKLKKEEAPAEPAVRVGGYGLDVGQCASISSIMEGKR